MAIIASYNPNEPTEAEKDMLRALLTDLPHTEYLNAAFAINACTDYEDYERLRIRLESLQKSIDEIANPLQLHINRHLRKFIKR